uniref:Uncharacterized protein n=1 Tax=Tanacetum cinerariifolium TaxID=118510 RepID=A0A699S558_TANCI|nr:hypothetical protein [Tanacetum cinerariifolium]
MGNHHHKPDTTSPTTAAAAAGKAAAVAAVAATVAVLVVSSGKGVAVPAGVVTSGGFGGVVVLSCGSGVVEWLEVVPVLAGDGRWQRVEMAAGSRWWRQRGFGVVGGGVVVL